MLTYIYLFIAILFLSSVSFAQQNQQQAAPKVQKSMEDLEEYGRLEEKIKSGEKAYIEDIVVEGITLLSRDEVNAVVEPYFKHWLTQKDIQQIISSLKDSYQKKSQALPQISYRIEGNKLIIEAEE